MQEEIVTFETAKLAKEKGFNEKCFHYYVHKWGNSFTDIHGQLFEREVKDDQGYVIGFYKTSNSKGQPHLLVAPTQSLLQRWLREVHDVDVFVSPDKCYSYGRVYDVVVYKDFKMVCQISAYQEYEKALEAGLQEALKLV